MTRIWREVRHVLLSVAMGVAAVGLLLGTAVGLVWPRVFGWVVGRTRWLATVQRGRCAPPVTSLYAPLPDDPPERLAALRSDPATRRDLGWLGTQAALAPVGLILLAGWPSAVMGVLTPLLRRIVPADMVFAYQGIPVTDMRLAWLMVPLGLATALIPFLFARWYIVAEGWIAGQLLAPTEAAVLAARVERLAETRAAVVDASAAELRRIERDLHDGAQARLVALAMNLGMAEDMFETNPETARAMLAEARSDARSAMGELRDLVRGIHPPILADRGLPGALSALAMVSSVPIDLDLRLDRRLPAPMEAAAYFALAELVANAIKHSGASSIAMAVEFSGSRLVMRVRDDGCGGADPRGGTGLTGIRRRLAAFDGTVRVDSPAGGPTLVEMELPCGW
ncbi:sensor histidine kinase [Virgisporangium aurantiacum]|uniref:histidine kinase n=1 Tax=Virgisporangium aurantiacum TaxID=175570 RepID=A0A8J3ZCD9_9ACTN|nr:histidine kinase [Virgisporangium aurantiacum]GIJ59061.1 histidine kinase [Virgisporangium aurantiacum]